MLLLMELSMYMRRRASAEPLRWFRLMVQAPAQEETESVYHQDPQQGH